MALNPWFLKGLICFAFFAALVLLLLAPRRTNVNDFVAYWSAGSRLIHGHDPYATGPVLLLEKEEGFTGPAPLVMRNPPWIAPIIAPLGLFTFAVAQRLWLASGLLAVLISIKWLWDLYRLSGQSGLLTSVAIAVFSPVAVALTIGQISPLILLGIAGFLRFENRGRLDLAGAFLVLVALKPHLVFLLWVAVVLCSMYNRSARMLWMLTLTTVVASLVALLFDHSIFGEYFAFVRREGVLHELTPTLGGMLRLLLRSYVEPAVLDWPVQRLACG